VQEAAKLVPLSRLMCETDAPYLSPEPHRTTRPCEPWMSSVTARFLAGLRGEPWEVFHDAINASTRAFFGIEAR
jgi:TatD DNase family protein